MLARSRALALLLACLMAVVPLFTVAVAGGASLDGPTYASDPYDPADDVYTGATDVTSSFAALGSAADASALDRVIDEVQDFDADEDWFRMTVSSADVAAGATYLIEADARAHQTAATGIEMYGPIETTSVAPTVPWKAPGGDLNEPGTGCIAQSFGDNWHDDAYVSTLGFAPEAAGTYYFRVRPWGEPDGGYGTWSDAGPYRLRLKFGLFSRIAGTTRIGTAAQLSAEQYATGVKSDPGSEFGTTVVVANAADFPDALSGAALAGGYASPLLLTQPNALSAETHAELVRLAAQDVILVGGTGAIGGAVEAELAAMLGTGHVRRVEGSDRAGTAAAVARDIAANRTGGTLRGVFLVDGYTYPDALSASPMAALNDCPTLMTHTDSLDAVTRAAMVDLDVENVVIVGGTGAVSPAVEAEVAALVGADHVRRIAGVNRYETAEEFAAWAGGLRDYSGSRAPGEMMWVGTIGTPDLFQPLLAEHTGVASGENFPDALSGGVFCGHAQAPILLTPADGLSPWIAGLAGSLPAGETSYRSELATELGKDIGRSYLFGGTGAVSDVVLVQLERSTGNLQLLP